MYIGNTWNTWFLLVTDFVCRWSSIEVELSPVTWVQVIRGGMNSKRSESMRNVTTISCMFYLYRYVYVITYKCRGRNAENNKSDKISILVLSILVQRYLVSLISTCNERYLCCRDMQQITVVVRLLKTYRETESSIINDRSRETRNIYAFPSHLQPTHVCCDCWPDLCACKAITVTWQIVINRIDLRCCQTTL